MNEFIRLKNEIMEIRKDCKEKDWDSYDAVPISEESIAGALHILDVLNSKYGEIFLKDLEVSPCPDGEIMFEVILDKDEFRILIV